MGEHERRELSDLTEDLGTPPEAWDEVPTYHRPYKSRITLRIDKDVEVFFRAMGRGWQTRANLVLRSFMLSRTAPAPAVLKAAAHAEVGNLIERHRIVRGILKAEGLDCDHMKVAKAIVDALR